MTDPGTQSRRVLIGGSLLEAALFAAFFLVPFGHLWGQMPPQPTAGGPSTNADMASAVTVALIFAIPCLVPFAPIALLPAKDGQRRPLLIGVLVAIILLPALVALVTYPCCTSDVLDYVNRVRLWTVYGDNPFTLVPNDHPEDWSYYFANFKDLPASYGPIWWLLARGFTQWASSLDEYLLGFKALAALSFGLSAALVWRLADARSRLVSLAFFAWNPAVLIEGVLRAHNDLVTVPFALAALWLWRANRGSASLVMAALGVLVKVTLAPLGLALLGPLVRGREWRTLVTAGVAIAIVATGLLAPFWTGPRTLAALVAQANRPEWSLGSLLLVLGEPLLGSSTLAIVRVVLGLVCLTLLARVLWRADGACRVAETGVALMLVVLLLIPLAFYSHYLMPAVALAAVATDARVRWLVLAIGFGAMLNAVLGVDSLAGGPSGTVLDVTGSLVLLAAVAAGLAIAASRAVRPARS